MENYQFLSPSEAYDRIEELKRKMEYEGLTEDETEELNELQRTFQELFNYYETDF